MPTRPNWWIELYARAIPQSPAATAVGRRDGLPLLQLCWLAGRQAGQPVENPRQIRLERGEVDGIAQPGIEVRILSEIVGDQHHVDEIVIDGVVETLDQPAAVSGHAAKADLALLVGALGELRLDDARIVCLGERPRLILRRR